ncbi:MAG: transcription-repair coupling factor [Pleomorphochaeta sp.]
MENNNNITDQIQQYLKTSKAFKELNSGNNNIQITSLEGFVLAQFVRRIYRTRKKRVWVICSTQDSAKNLLKDFAQDVDKENRINNLDRYNNEVPILYLPSNGKKIYSEFESGKNEYSQLEALTKIDDFKESIIITHLRAFASEVVSQNTLNSTSFTIRHKDVFEPTNIAEIFSEAGYVRVPSTSMPGEFSLRGEVVDIFPFSFEDPIRIYADWDVVEKIAVFDALTQETIKVIDKVSIPLLKENDLNLNFSKIDSYFRADDYFCFIGDVRLNTSYKSLVSEAKSLYREAYHRDKSIKPYSQILFDFPKFFQSASHKMTLVDIINKDNEAYSFDVEGPRSYFGDFTRLKGELTTMFQSNWNVYIFTSNAIQKQRLQQMLKQFNRIKYIDYEISRGFSIPSIKLIAFCESEIFGRRKQIIKTLQHTKSSPLDSFVDLNEGDYVVHVNYGIGKFIKIDRVKSFDRERDYIKIAYANGDNIYVPIEQANLVQRYIGSSSSSPKLDKIGSSVWENKKAKARVNAEKLAKYLIELYAKRKAAIGFPFDRDNDMQLQFEALFPYQETVDQLKCIDDIKVDMESNSVMDRLVCGDVGFGKTEIAFRAAFKAVLSNKQVAFLAPTTILAEQHYNNFVERVKDFPVNVALLSRVIPKKEQKKILLSLIDGKVDVLFGTHRILQKDIIYKDLGLLVIDEEQRFGVKDKEKIKNIRTSIDSLALSATPIPRTLYMSLLKIRDMSLLATPPIARHPIETKIVEYDIKLVIEAIKKEIARGGQIFYLHNRIESLDAVVSMLSELLPDVIIESAHGQMEPKALEDTMRRFVHEGIQVLVSTTIIENGIDIPNVNTIIIDRADMYGIAQLYQLRGRVGRSNNKAYAYLLYPADKALSEIAVKRLKTIGENTGLGAGFKVSMRDMEIRGAGNLLGKEQSGQLASVGLDMYIRILDEAINELRTNDKDELEQEVFLELDYTGFIPDDYIKEPSIKFEIYKKIATVKTEAELDMLNSELTDRFGEMPEEVSNLIHIAELKIVCRKLKIIHLTERKGNVLAKFRAIKYINGEKLLRLLPYSNGAVSYDTKRPEYIKLKTEAISLKDKSLFILEMLQRLL